MPNPSTKEAHKVSFLLEQDEEGYPPAQWEHLWASSAGPNRFVLDNTPFFVRGVSLGDLVLTEERDGLNLFRALVVPSGHSTLRVVLFDQGLRDRLRDALREQGCASELSHLPNLLSIDVPPEIEIDPVLHMLRRGHHEGRWDYEEAAVRHATDSSA